MLTRVKKERLQRELSVGEVATQIGISRQAISRVESGVQYPWPRLREKLSAFYELPDNELFADLDASQEYLRKLTRGEIAMNL